MPWEIETLLYCILTSQPFKCSDIYSIAICIKMGLRENLTEICALTTEELTSIKTPEAAWKLVVELDSDMVFWVIGI
jgi:hypothetical protein